MTLVAVLAGGAGRRMGSPKPLAPLGGRALILWPLAAAAAAGLEAVVVAKAGTPLPALGDVAVWREPDAPHHPLLGIVTALERAGGPVIAAGCDQPWLPPALLARLAAAEGAAAPRAAGELAPLPARYPYEALPALRAALAAQAPLRRTLAALDPEAIELGDPGVLAGVNTPAELAAAQELASRAS
jgi:molybdopterin-guanine dinucleotide biosynthesis protein A